MDLGLKGKRALVLGASGGLGGAICRSLVAEGAHVVASGRERTRTEELVAELGGGEAASSLIVDLADRDSLEAALETLGPRGQTQIDILVNNGGGPPPGPVLDVAASDWTDAFQAMINALFSITAHLVPAMCERGFGRVITITSSGVQQPIDNLGMSNTLRPALIGYGKTLANEVAGRGVTVNAVLPGRIATSRLAALNEKTAQRTGRDIETVREASRQQIPAGRFGEPEEFADVVTFLASERAAYITGSQIRVDGSLIRHV